jgi:hemerythrin
MRMDWLCTGTAALSSPPPVSKLAGWPVRGVFSRQSFIGLIFKTGCGRLSVTQPMLEWKSEYETGVPAIDTQHKVLFDNINRLGKLLDKAAIERAESDYLLEFLEQYAAQHFQSEETCMARFHCPAHAQNKLEHSHFMDVVRYCRTEYTACTSTREVLERLHESLVW